MTGNLQSVYFDPLQPKCPQNESVLLWETRGELQQNGASPHKITANRSIDLLLEMRNSRESSRPVPV